MAGSLENGCGFKDGATCKVLAASLSANARCFLSSMGPQCFIARCGRNEISVMEANELISAEFNPRGMIEFTAMSALPEDLEQIAARAARNLEQGLPFDYGISKKVEASGIPVRVLRRTAEQEKPQKGYSPDKLREVLDRMIFGSVSTPSPTSSD